MSGKVLQVPRELLERYAVAAPRYTSYPTAVDWRNNLDLSEYDARLTQAAAAHGPSAVYVHVPFCEERCLFCGCNVFITHDHHRASSYVEHLEREIQAVGRSGFGARAVTQYHWGGGTPTFLSEADIQRLHQAFLQVFTLAPDAEVAIEADPRVTTDAQLQLLGRLGFNRLSLGIQDFDPQVQVAVKRVQSVEETRRVVDVGRESGFQSVNVDLIYGLPRQTLDGFQRTLEEVLRLTPDRVALFHYAHVPWLKKHQTALDLQATPSPELKMTIFTKAVETFTEAGYEYLGLDHFARPDDELARARADRTLQRNFMGYSTRAGTDLLGLGVSSIGEIAGAYFQNDPVLGSWREAVAAGGFGIIRGHQLDHDDLLRRRVIMNLMCHGIVVKSEIDQAFGVTFDEIFAQELEEMKSLAKDGLVELEPAAVILTPLGQVFMRNVAVCFDRYYRERHAGQGGPAQTFSRTL